MSRLKDSYAKFFSISEISQSKRLQIFFWAIWGISLFDIGKYSNSIQTPFREAVCWDHFQNCVQAISLGVFPVSYSYTTLMALLLLLLFGSAYSAIKRNWAMAHAFLTVVAIWKSIWFLGFFDYSTSNFEYFHLIPAFVFLLFPNKLKATRYIWAFLYFLCSLVKLDESWILGKYFSTLQIGLPFLPDSSIPLATNAVIIFEMIFSIGMLSQRKSMAKTSLWLWTFFHLYSTIVVAFYYPIRCLLYLWALFGFENIEDTQNQKALQRGIAPAYLVAAIFLCANAYPYFLSDRPYETHEGAHYGMSMISSNYQCINRLKIFTQNGAAPLEKEFGSSSAMIRCEPLRMLQRIRRMCPQNEKISWILWQSRNGNPFYEMVNVEDACTLEYKMFKHNFWIHTAEESEIKGYPQKNSIFPESTGPVPKVFSTPQISLTPLQSYLSKHSGFLEGLYRVVWVLILVLFFIPPKVREKIL